MGISISYKGKMKANVSYDEFIIETCKMLVFWGFDCSIDVHIEPESERFKENIHTKLKKEIKTTTTISFRYYQIGADIDNPCPPFFDLTFNNESREIIHVFEDDYFDGNITKISSRWTFLEWGFIRSGLDFVSDYFDMEVHDEIISYILPREELEVLLANNTINLRNQTEAYKKEIKKNKWIYTGEFSDDHEWPESH